MTAILHEGEPVRFWDHDLGPDGPRLLAARRRRPTTNPTWTDLTPDRGRGARAGGVRRHPGRVARCSPTWRVDEPHGASRQALVALDVPTDSTPPSTACCSTTPTTPSTAPSPSPPTAGRVACLRTAARRPLDPPDVRCVVVPVDGGEPRDVAPGWDRWVTDLALDARLARPWS